MKKGRYIVIIDGPIIDGETFESKDSKPGGDFPIGHVFKQLEHLSYLCPELDGKGSKINGWGCYGDEHYEKNWRYADEVEIGLYDAAKKPVSVLNINIDNYSII